MGTDSWYGKLLESTNLPLVRDVGEGDSLAYALELGKLDFKSLPDGKYAIQLSFYDFRRRQFFGSQWGCACTSRSSTVRLDAVLNFRAYSEPKSMVAVIEFLHGEKRVICWTAIALREISQMLVSTVPGPDGGQMGQNFPIFAGSCRALLLGDSLVQLQSHLQRLDAILVASLRLCAPPSQFLPEYHFQLAVAARQSTDPVPPTFTAVLDNLTLSQDAELSDALIVEMLSREYCYGLNRTLAEKGTLCILEKRLKIGAHNGMGFAEEPTSVLLHRSTGDQYLNRRRSYSLGRREANNSSVGRPSSADLYSRNSVRTRHLIADPSMTIVFILEYLVGSRREGTDILSEARLFRVAWAAWAPCVNGKLSMADTVSLQLVGGTRPSPIDGLFLRELSSSPLSFSGSPASLQQLPPATRPKMQLHFNFVPIPDDHQTQLSALSTMQTPLPHPDTRPQSSASASRAVSPSTAPRRIKDEDPKERAEDGTLSPISLQLESAAIKRSRPTTPKERSALIVHEQGQQNIQEVDVPAARVSAFPRRVLLRLSHFPFAPIADSGAKPVDPTAKREINLALESTDRLAANEVAIQLMAFTKFGGNPFVHRFFFTFQFYRFAPVTTESLFTDPSGEEGDGRELDALWREEGSAERRAPGLIIRFVVAADEMAEFSRFLMLERMQLDVWETDSLLHLGTASVPLQCLLRQCSHSVLCSLQCPVLQTGLPSAVVGADCPLGGLLYLRMACTGLPTSGPAFPFPSSPPADAIPSTRKERRAHSLRSIIHGKSPLERFLAFQKLDLEQRSARLFGEVEDRRVREWTQLRGRNDTALLANGAASKKFLFSEELAAFRAMRREGKAMALLRAVFSAITTRIRVDVIGGQVHLLRSPLRNPFPEECVCALEVSDTRLSAVTSGAELRHFRTLGRQQGVTDAAEDTLFAAEEGEWRIALRPMESVDVVLRWESGTSEADWGNTEARAFFRRVSDDTPLCILELSVSTRRPFVSLHHRWMCEEQSKLVRGVPLAATVAPLCTRTSDPTVFTQIQQRPNAPSSAVLRIECLVGEFPQLREFLVFLYADPFHSQLWAVQRFSIHSVGKLHVETVQGRRTRVQLPLSPAHLPVDGQLVRVFCAPASASSADSLGVLPPPALVASSPAALVDLCVQLQPHSQGRHHLLVTVVATDTVSLLGHWLLSVNVAVPNVVKVFEVRVPGDVQSPLQKRIPLHNPLGVARRFRLSSSDERVLSLPSASPPPLGPHSSAALAITLHPPSTRPLQTQTLLFVEDADLGVQEEAYAVRALFE